jgi:DNA-binding response OmpR family regulator
MSARILVVDDSPTIRKVVASILTAREYDAILAEDGQTALELLDTEKVDLVLLDFVMPRMNGYQFCRELRARPDLKNLPVVLMSAKGDKIRGQFVEQTGATDAITKPFDARGLVAVVEGALKRQKE